MSTSIALALEGIGWQFDLPREPRAWDDRYADFPLTAAPQYRVQLDLGSPDPTDSPNRRDREPAITADGAVLRLRTTHGAFTLDARGRGAGRVRDHLNAVDGAMRLLAAGTLPAHDALLLHAAGVQAGGRAWVCCGESGAGKTTLARKVGAARVLSDELSGVQLTAAGVWAFGTPFAGELQRSGRNARAPLAALVFLAPGRPCAVRRLGPAQALLRLARVTFCFFEEGPRVAAVAALHAALLTRVPALELSSRREDDAERLLAALAAAGPAPA